MVEPPKVVADVEMKVSSDTFHHNLPGDEDVEMKDAGKLDEDIEAVVVATGRQPQDSTLVKEEDKTKPSRVPEGKIFMNERDDQVQALLKDAEDSLDLDPAL